MVSRGLRSSEINDDVLDLQIIAFSTGTRSGLESDLTKPKSVGHLTFEEKKGTVKPIIHSNFLKDHSDRSRLLEGIEFAQKIAHTKPLSELIDFEKSDPVINSITEIKENLEHFQHGLGTIPMGEILDWSGHVRVLSRKLKIFVLSMHLSFHPLYQHQSI